MTRRTFDGGIDTALAAWMRGVAPDAVPVSVLEEAFARTMTAPQVRVYPWQRVARRSGRSRRLTLLSLVATAVLLVVALGFGALGGGSVIAPGPSPTPSPTVIPSPTAIPPSPFPATPAPTPFPASPIVPTASIAVLAPQSLATDGKVVWVMSSTGSVQRIDPATNTAGASIATGGPTDLYNGISVDANGVWVPDWDTKTLFRIDPTTSKVAATIEVGLAPKGVLATGSAVWVADTHDGKVYRIDPRTNGIVATITVGPTGNSGPNWLGTGFGSIWASVPNASAVVRIDPTSNKVQATIHIPVEVAACGGFAFTESDVWMPSCGGRATMARIDPEKNVVAGIPRPDGAASTPAVIDGAAWVSVYTGPAAPGYLARLSPEQDAVDLGLSPGGEFVGGGDIVVAAGSAWVIDNGNDRILRLPLTGFTAR